jgi:hypothetical protein
MGFFKDLTVELDRSPATRRRASRGDMSEILKYAPLKSRPRRSAEDRLTRFEADTVYWRERALRAENRVRYLETSIERIASLPAARHPKAG